MSPAALQVFEDLRRELGGLVLRLVARPEVAEDVVQQTAVRLLEADQVPDHDPAALRRWIFRVGTNLALDHLRRHSTWRETFLLDARARAEADPPFVAESLALRGSPETAQIAREHLDVCLACTLRNAGAEGAAALLLHEAYGFTVEEVAEVLAARPAQVKGWIQRARAELEARYASSCALVSGTGVCHQCVELDAFFGAGRGDPLRGTAGDVGARLAIVRERAREGLGRWHRRMMGLAADEPG
jgi:RNA polymerase sigma-70 factor (ECF subfamily)